MANLLLRPSGRLMQSRMSNPSSQKGKDMEKHQDRLESVCRVTKFVAGLALVFTIGSTIAVWYTEAGAGTKAAALLGLCCYLAMLTQHRDKGTAR